MARLRRTIGSPLALRTGSGLGALASGRAAEVPWSASKAALTSCSPEAVARARLASPHASVGKRSFGRLTSCSASRRASSAPVSGRSATSASRS
jgi:hypothetical protein